MAFCLIVYFITGLFRSTAAFFIFFLTILFGKVCIPTTFNYVRESLLTLVDSNVIVV